MNLKLIPAYFWLLSFATASRIPDRQFRKRVYDTSSPRPLGLFSPLEPQQSLLANGGATNPYPRAVNSLQLPSLGMNDGAHVRELLADIQDGLRYILQTNNSYTLALHGTGMTGMTAVFDNLIEKGDKVLVLASEYWGFIAEDVAKRLGANVDKIMKPSSFKLHEIEDALKKFKPKILFLVHGDSSTGTFQDLKGVGDLCHLYNCLSIVDTVATIGQQPIRMDELKIDAIFGNSQKGCGGIVGLSPVSFSARAVAKIKSRKSSPTIRPTDILSQAKTWNIEESDGTEIAPHTPSFPLLYMLREGLASIAAEGAAKVWERHSNTSKFLYDEAALIGMEFMVSNPDERLQGTIVFKVPKGKDALKITSYALRNHRVDMSPGFAYLRGKMIRVGLFGNNASRNSAAKTLLALKSAVDSSETNV